MYGTLLTYLSDSLGCHVEGFNNNTTYTISSNGYSLSCYVLSGMWVIAEERPSEPVLKWKVVSITGDAIFAESLDSMVKKNGVQLFRSVYSVISEACFLLERMKLDQQQK